MKIINNATRPNEKKEIPTQSIWQKFSVICLYLLVFLTPLFFLPLTIAPLEINKQFLAGVLVLIAFICYLINSFETKKIVYPKSLTSLAVIILLLILGISFLFSGSKFLSLFGNLFQSDSLVSFIIYGLAFFLFAVFFREEKNLKWLKLVFFICLFLVTFLGFLSIFGKFIFPWNFTQQIGFNTIGSLLSFAIFIAFGLVMILGEIGSSPIREKKFSYGAKKQGKRVEKIKLIALIGLGLLIVFTLMLLNLPFIWLSLAIITFIFVGYKFITSKVNSFLIILLVLFLFFGIFSSFFPSLASLPIEVRPNLSLTWEIITGTTSVKNWLIGTGPATFSQNWALFRPIELNQTNLWPLRFHQGFSFLTTLPSTIGVLGFLAIIFLIFAFIREIFWKKEIKSIELGIIFLLFSWLLVPNFFTQSLFIFIGLGLATALSSSVKEISLTTLSKRKIFIIFVILTILITLSFSTLFIIAKKYLAAVYYEKGIRIYNQTGDLKIALTNFDKVRRLDSSDEYLRTLSQFLLLRADQLITKGESGLTPDQLQLEAQNIIALAIDVARQAILINRNESLNYSNLANVYERIMPVISGTDSFAEENYKKAMALDPQNPQEPVNLARSLILAADIYGVADPSLKQDKLDKAKTYLEESLKLKSDYAPTHFLLAVISTRQGKIQEAIAKLELTKQIVPFDAGLAFQLGLIYYQDEQLDKAKTEFERAIGINPDYSNARYFLGLIYDQEGKKDLAIEQFERIEKLNPENEEVKKILTNLRDGKPALEGIVPPAQPPTKRLEAPIKEKESK